MESRPTTPIEYTSLERSLLWTLAAVGFVGINGVFLYGAVVEPAALYEAMTNPVAAAFMAEAMILMLAFAYLLGRWGVARLGWAWFVVLSLLGSMLFALPVVLLWKRERRAEEGGC